MSDDGATVELPRLDVLVRARRVLRFGARAALLALPGWFVAVVLAVTVYDEVTARHVWFEDHATRGFLVVLAVLVVDLALAITVGRAGPAGALAARLVPLFRARPDPVLTTRLNRTQETALLDVGSRSVRVDPPGALRWVRPTLWLLVALMAGVLTAAGPEVVPEYRASHGQGGPVVTLGETSRITGMQEYGPLADSEDQDRYYISTPLGEASVDTYRRPEAGTRYVVLSSRYGLRGVEVGGDDWVDDLVGTIMGSLGLLMSLGFLIRRRRARVVDERVVPLVTTVADAVRGRNVTVCPWTPSRTGPVATLTVARSVDVSNNRARREADELAAELVADLRRRTRNVTAGLMVVLVLAGLAVAFVG